jgi:hypothetical protein
LVIGEFPRAPGAHKPAAIVVYGRRVYEFGTGQASVAEEHFGLLLSPRFPKRGGRSLQTGYRHYSHKRNAGMRERVVQSNYQRGETW